MNGGPYRQEPQHMKISVSFTTEEIKEAIIEYMGKKQMNPVPKTTGRIHRIWWDKLRSTIDSIGWDHLCIEFDTTIPEPGPGTIIKK